MELRPQRRRSSLLALLERAARGARGAGTQDAAQHIPSRLVASMAASVFAEQPAAREAALEVLPGVISGFASPQQARGAWNAVMSVSQGKGRRGWIEVKPDARVDRDAWLAHLAPLLADVGPE